MKKLLTLLSAIAFTLGVSAQTADFFSPYRQSKLRLPSYPILMNDPYFSIWSPFDHLYDGYTQHWARGKKPLNGILRVDGKNYRFMGSESKAILQTIVPAGDEDGYEALYTREKPAEDWTSTAFEAQGWKEGKGAFGSEGNTGVRTIWKDYDSDIWVRRHITLSEQDLQEDLYLVLSFDDDMEVYVNGQLLAKSPSSYGVGVRLHLDAQQKAMLKAGDNLIAMHCHNDKGGAMADMGIAKDIAPKGYNEQNAEQLSVSVMATSTYYTFRCGGIDLDLVFTAPMLIDDLDMLSTPINYISYQVRSNDGKAHEVKFYLSTTPEMALFKSNQPTESSVVEHHGIQYLKTGTIEQPYLARAADNTPIDWGYFYLAGVNGKLTLSNLAEARTHLMENETPSKGEPIIRNFKASTMPVLAYEHDFGNTSSAASFAMVGYDEVYDIEYMYERYKGYWEHEGKVTLFDAFEKYQQNYAENMAKAKALDKRIYDDGLQAGNEHYAEILSGSYRQVVAAHKLFKDKDGNLLYFSRENNSNSCVNTVDLTYPSAPLFLLYNPELQKGMMTSIFEYSKSGRWTKPFAAHDLGTYPKANGQVYGGDMPLEEAGNMVILTAEISKIEGNTQYADRYWDLLTTWTDYLVENGQDPSNQLCTDDFAGHWAHNCNLSIKAIMGIAGYAEMCKLKGRQEDAKRYLSIAQKMAKRWVKDGYEGDHYRLAFDRPNTWSQKYNMIWDKLWNLNVFPKDAMPREVSFYLKHQNKFGLPLDCRKDYTKTDWIMWSATMAKEQKDFLQLMEPVYTYINETSSRVPLSDWSDTKTGRWVGFKARSVIGGYWMKVLMDKIKNQK
ncbi:MAG: DUF4965 domain-containing protein [Prevotella sp.]|jgi:hypothetical protein|nr:DUF4965 domain-containing protein [Prevotella sp.]